VERTAFFIHLALYAAFVVPLFAFNILFDYAKIRAVVEDRRSMISAIAASWRFIRRHPIAVWAVYKINAVVFLLVIGLYYVIAPGASADALAFAIGQLYIVLRVIVRLQFTASQTALFQGRLAHAGYVARPVPKWPIPPPLRQSVRDKRNLPHFYETRKNVAGSFSQSTSTPAAAVAAWPKFLPAHRWPVARNSGSPSSAH
jgi:hypothetical protein